jgi:hypothetical protein
VSFHGKSGDIAGSEGKFLERPTGGFGWISLSTEYCGRFPRSQRHVKLVQGQ